RALGDGSLPVVRHKLMGESILLRSLWYEKRMVAAASATSPFELRGDRRGVLLLHGFTGTPFEVRSLGEALHARLGVTVSGPLLAGHGGSARALAATGWRDWEASALSALVELRARCDGVVVAGLAVGCLLARRLP